MHRHPGRKRERIDTTRLLWLQGAAALSVVAVGTLLAGIDGALSALMGGLVSLIPSLYFAWRIGSVRGGRQAGRFVSNLYRAEAGKFGLTVALLAMVFVAAPPSNPIFFFVAYVAVVLAHWLLPWTMRRRPAP
ncbi:ATP synthase subunit I [Billgrantia sp. Q4P2]|uniref:ATP synthase subunit I n=1 Tax=Billgrantia sp. Q4P2 TaxID=3463857 RepID=UPI004056AF95